MQSTANLWVLLCQELGEQQQARTSDEQLAAVRTFEEAARSAFAGSRARLEDALEIAGDTYQANGLTAEAIRCFGEALQVSKELDVATATARLATKLALLSDGVMDPKTTVRFYVTAIEAMEKSNDHSQLPTLLNNLAALHKHAGDFDASERTYRRALSEVQRLHGPNHPEVALIANNLGVACSEQGRQDQAENLHMLALAIRERNFGSAHPDVAQSMANLAAVFHQRKLYVKAEGYYKAALDILGNFRRKDDPEMMEIQENLGRLPQVRVRNLSKTRRL